MVAILYVSGVSLLFSIVGIGLFIWRRHPGRAYLEPFHDGMGTLPVVDGLDLCLSLAWWPASHDGLVALHTRHVPMANASVTTIAMPPSRHRRGIDPHQDCLVVPPEAPHVARISPGYGFLVDHTSSRGGVFAGGACPDGHEPAFDESSVAWVGCSRLLHPAWTGYVCRHPASGHVVLDCPTFDKLAGCHIGDDMPCQPHDDDVGCIGGLMPGETCRQACPANHRLVRPHQALQASCPLEAPECMPVCQADDIPRAPSASGFAIEWDDDVQVGLVRPGSNTVECRPTEVTCGFSYENVSCWKKRCPPLAWAGILDSVEQGTTVAPRCPPNEKSPVSALTCRSDGTWSHPHPSCHASRPPTIRTQTGLCINNRRIVSKTVVDPGFPPITTASHMSWSERCHSGPPRCCPDKGLATSDGFYLPGDVPQCRCRFEHLGYGNPKPCCEPVQEAPRPPMEFVSEFAGVFDLVACNPEPCSASDCQRHPLGCLAFNKSHMARAGSCNGHEVLKTAFTWKV